MSEISTFIEDDILNHEQINQQNTVEVEDENDEFILDFTELKSINAAKTLVKIPVNICKAEQGVRPKSSFNLALQIQQLRVPTFGTYAELKLLETAQNLGDTPEDFKQSIGKRVNAVHITVYGHHILTGEDEASGEEFTFNPERQELITFRLGVSKDRRSNNPNKWSAAVIFDDNSLFWELSSDKKKEKSSISVLNKKQWNAETQFAGFVKDLFEGFDLTRLEEGGDLNHLSDKMKAGYRAYIDSLHHILNQMPIWENPTATKAVEVNGASVGQVTPTVTTTQPTNVEDLVNAI